MTHASLFSGIGGFDLAAQWMGWQNIFHCENNPFCQTILKHYWPNSISYGDIKTTDFTIHAGGIDILTGGFPCQPYSTAGKRKGTADDRHLWPEMLRAIREIKPRWVVGENVHGIVNWSAGVVFEQVQAQMEAAGYQVQPYILPACAINAPHRRDRVWFVAYAGCLSSDWRQNIQSGNSINNRQNFGWKEETNILEGLSKARATTHHTNPGPEGLREKKINFPEPELVTHTTSLRHSEPGRHTSNLQSKIATAKRIVKAPATAHTNKRRLERIDNQAPGQQPVNGNAWCEFPTQSPVCGRNDGFPAGLDNITFSKWRNESIKGYGNAIVPQVALQIFKTIQEFETFNLRP